MLGFGRGWRRGLLGLYRAALLHTSISSDSFPLLAVPLTRLLFPSFPPDIRGLPPLPPLPPLSNLLYLFYLLLLLRFCLPPRPLHPSFATRLPKPRLASATPLATVLLLNSDRLSCAPFPFPSFLLPVHALALGFYLETLSPTNKPQTLCTFTQS